MIIMRCETEDHLEETDTDTSQLLKLNKSTWELHFKEDDDKELL